MSARTLETAERELDGLPRTFFAVAEAADRLGLNESDARDTLASMEHCRLAARVCRDGWVMTWRYGQERGLPDTRSYLHDMMRHLDVGYYLSYAAAASMLGASHHAVMRVRVQVETCDIDALQLAEADGPLDSAVSFHPIAPAHRRHVETTKFLCLPPVDHARGIRAHRSNLRIATAETSLLDMVERPDRCGGMDHVATIARKMMFWHLLHPALLAECSDAYEPQVARRAGSMLQRIRNPVYRMRLGSLARRTRWAAGEPPVELHSSDSDFSRKPDRWGVTCSRPLDPDV